MPIPAYKWSHVLSSPVLMNCTQIFYLWKSVCKATFVNKDNSVESPKIQIIDGVEEKIG